MAMGKAASEGRENGKTVELKVGKGLTVMFPESGRVAFGVPEKMGVVLLNPEGGGEVASKPGEGGTMP